MSAVPPVEVRSAPPPSETVAVDSVDVIIIGAGMAGLSAARALAPETSVRILDKGRGVGGRLATRRINGAVLDHGAQFFTVRGDDFAAMVDSAQEANAIEEWCQGFAIEDGYPRYRGTAGMTSLAKWMAGSLSIDLGVEVSAVEATGSTIRCRDAEGSLLAEGTNAIVTAPIPQSLRLLQNGAVRTPPPLLAALEATDYFATLALLVTIEGEPNVAEPGGMQLDDGPFTFIADNYRKGISPTGALTFHANHDYSLRRFDDDGDEVLNELLELAKPWIGNARLTTAQLKKWRYAGPVKPLPNATEVIDCGSSKIALAGDAFAGPKVEGAFNSGLAAARALG